MTPSKQTRTRPSSMLHAVRATHGRPTSSRSAASCRTCRLHRQHAHLLRPRAALLRRPCPWVCPCRLHPSRPTRVPQRIGASSRAAARRRLGATCRASAALRPWRGSRAPRSDASWRWHHQTAGAQTPHVARWRPSRSSPPAQTADICDGRGVSSRPRCSQRPPPTEPSETDCCRADACRATAAGTRSSLASPPTRRACAHCSGCAPQNGRSSRGTCADPARPR
mmetsp:Transcript_34756/g.87333  ORF Transcript_34756/g.87333 Transcript_34756/m.87333 type:complete len:224 (+) Transcript_34756:223-894(+)